MCRGNIPSESHPADGHFGTGEEATPGNITIRCAFEIDDSFSSLELPAWRSRLRSSTTTPSSSLKSWRSGWLPGSTRWTGVSSPVWKRASAARSPNRMSAVGGSRAQHRPSVSEAGRIESGSPSLPARLSSDDDHLRQGNRHALLDRMATAGHSDV